MVAANFPKDIQYLKGVGEKRALLYKKLGIADVGALLRFYPRAYLDFTNPCSIATAPYDEPCVIRARVFAKAPEQRIRKGMTLYKVFATDDSTDLVLTFFNTPYTAEGLEEGTEYLFYGRAAGTRSRREMPSPLVFPADEEAGLRPVYPLTAGLTNRIVAQNMKQALSLLDDNLSDPLPQKLRKDQELCHITFALRNIHFPLNAEHLALARKRLIFEELLTLSISLVMLKSRSREGAAEVLSNTDIEGFYAALPFQLTGAQRHAINDALKDMQRPRPMSRLIQGDVGSGKTAVAAALCYAAAKNGLQSALMAPTEILAQQHYASLSPLLTAAGISCALLTGSVKAAQKKEILSRLASGELSFIVGTHSLISPDVAFHKLGLVVADEQHRFGVQQRTALAQKGAHPHLLVMSATPIPRTLALMIYGDLDVSVLDELPPGRQAIKTYLIDSEKRHRAYNFIRAFLNEGRQAYIVCPLVEEGEGELASAEEFAGRLIDEDFRGYKVGLLHGKLKPSKKDEMMRLFQSGEIQLLVATTVIEVGVDVPNAVVMMIENAERFGLSQLHQLRGRVGRGKHTSYCILVSDNQNELTRERLTALCKTTDGFKLAEEDLRLRGPGDFFGNRQHGLPELRLANLVTDLTVLKTTQQAAQQIIGSDSTLSLPEHQGLKQNITELFGSVSVESFN